MNLADVRARDMWRCVKCGTGSGLHVHHRRKRSQGGQNSYENLVTLCSGCHEWVHREQVAARALGLLLGRGSDPAVVPVDHFCWPAGPVLLRADGGVSLC